MACIPYRMNAVRHFVDRGSSWQASEPKAVLTAPSTTKHKSESKDTPPQTASFERKTDAKRWGEQTEAAIRQRRYFNVFEAQRHTASEMIDRFIRDVLPNRPKQRRDLTSHPAWRKSEVGAHLLSELTPSVLWEARDRLSKGKTVRKKKRAPATVLRIMASLSAVLEVAERDWQWIKSSPMAKISKPVASRGRVRYLSADERNRLLSACEELGPPICQRLSFSSCQLVCAWALKPKPIHRRLVTRANPRLGHYVGGPHGRGDSRDAIARTDRARSHQTGGKQ